MRERFGEGQRGSERFREVRRGSERVGEVQRGSERFREVRITYGSLKGRVRVRSRFAASTWNREAILRKP